MCPPCGPSSKSLGWWDSLAASNRDHTPLAGACEVVPLGTVHHGPTHRDVVRARDARLPTMKVMRLWRQKITRTVIPALLCILCGGSVEDMCHVRILCERDKAVARLLCAKVEEFTADLPPADKAMEFLERARMQVDGVLNGRSSAARSQAALRGGEGCIILGPGEGQALLGGLDLDCGRCLHPEKSSTHQDNAADAKRSEDGYVCTLAR